ncbi:hypothetical protein CAEBREN_02784 [Caenorhabditis brenneri]|uniref:F-box C protein n=1 Tax=Caenorhabditis brenneri TaxID=135651 RepID=G0MML4_CAEBE|nr:hypothetical protein CAEBREN_02784 [Caenorhabditis brenneri]
MATTPISYDSLKIMLQYLKPDKRFQIAHRCPSIKAAERAAPLHLKSLHFSRGEVRVNNIIYNISIRRRSAIGIVEFTASHEVDRFGVEDPSDLAILTPGDVLVNGEPRREERAPDEIIEELQNRVQEYDARVRGVLVFEPNQRILEDRRKLLALQYRRDNVDPPYEHFLQLTIEDVKTYEKETQRFVYNKKFREAMKSIGEYLFSGRRLPINVKYLNVDANILRLPPGIIFRIEKISITRNAEQKCNSLMPILHESSFPLKKVILMAWNASDVTHPLVREAHYLRSNVSPDLPTFLAITNQKVKLRTVTTIFTFDFLNNVIENWIQTRKRVGTDFTIKFSFPEQPSFVHRLEEVCDRFNGTIIEEGCMTIPITGASQIHYKQSSVNDKWTLKMIVVAV